MNGVEKAQTSAPARAESTIVERSVDNQTGPKFGDVMNRIQSQYGAKAEKPREIKKTLGKDDFLKIMITQMKHQDPSAPFKAEQMAQQMAQFASVEQLQNMNTNITKLTNQGSSTDRMAMTGMIGKVVTTDRARFVHTEGQNELLSFTLPADAAEVRAVVFNDSGEAIFEKDLGSLSKGEQSLSWDGLNSKNLASKSGNYLYRVEAKTAQGARVPIDTAGKGKVIGVSFEGSEPVLLIGDNKRQEKITFKNIVRIETEEGAMAARPDNSPIGSVKNSRIFEFNKGMDPEAERQALEAEKLRTQSAQRDGRNEVQLEAAKNASAAGNEIAHNLMSAMGAADGKSALAGSAKDSGFPNGLSSGENESAGDDSRGDTR